MKFLLLFITQFILVQTFAQDKKITDSAYLNQLLNSTSKNVGKTYKNFDKKSLTGKRYFKKELAGKVILINCWFEACSPCVAEFDALNHLYKRYKTNKKFQFVSFTTDSPAEAKIVAQKYNLQFPIICVSENECYRLNYKSGFPTSIIIDTTYKIASIKMGGSIDKQIIADDIKSIEFEIDKLLSK